MSENAYGQERAGILALICSFLFPIVGVIIYFVNKDKVSNPSAYLIAAAIGFALGLIGKCAF